jgi:hypothetical protein
VAAGAPVHVQARAAGPRVTVGDKGENKKMIRKSDFAVAVLVISVESSSKLIFSLLSRFRIWIL